MSQNNKESPADNTASSFVSKIQQHPSTPTNMNEDTMHDKNTTPTTSSSTNMLPFRSSTLLAGDLKIDSESSDVNSIMESAGNKKNPSIEKEENSNIKFVDARKSPPTTNADTVDNDTSNSSASDNNDNSESEEESDTSLSTPTGFPSPSLLGAPTSPLANTLTTTISGRPSTGSPRPSTPPILLFSSSSGGENDPKKIKNIEEHTNLLPPLSIHNNNNGGGGSPTKMSPTKPSAQSQQESHHKQEKQQQGDTMFSLLPNFLRPFSNNMNNNNKDDEAVISQVPSSESENNNHQQNYNYNDNKQVFQSQLEFLSDETSEFLAIPSLQKNNNKNKKGDAVSAAKNASIFRSGNHNNNNNNTADEGTTAHHQHLHSSPENEAIRLNVQASDLLSRGKNEEALSIYRKAIRISKKDLASINSEIKELTSSTNKNNKTHQQSHQVRYSPTYLTKQHQAPPPSFLSSHGSFDSMVTVQHSNRQRDEELKAKRIEIASTIADTLNNMGVVYEMNDNYDEALKSCKEALRVYNEMCQREYNNNGSSLSNDDDDETKKNDPDIERTIRNIALIERAKESYPERQKLRSQAEEKLRMVESSLIHDSPHLPYPSSSQQQQQQPQEPAMGSLHPYQKQQLLREAFNIYIEAFNLEREWLGGSHPTTARTLQLIGNIRWRLIQNNNNGGGGVANNNEGNMSVQDTTRDLSQAAKILEMALGPIHPHVINALLDLAALKDLLGDTQSALTLYQKALTSQKTSFGEAHQDIGTTLNNIGVIYFNLEEYDKALATYKEAISTYMAISESNNQEGEEIIIHPDTALVWNNIGELHKLRKDWGQASRALEESLKILAETSGSNVDNSKYVHTLINTAEMNLKAKKINKALLMYEQAYTVQCNNNTNNNNQLEIAKTLDHLAHVQKLKGLFRDSQQSLTKALEIRRQELGDTQHVEIAKTLVKLGTLQIQMRKNQDAIIILTESLRLFDINDVSEHHPMVKDARRKRDAVCLSLHQHTSEIMWMKKLNKKWEKNSNIHSTKNHIHNNFSSSSSPSSQSSSLPDLFDAQAISMKHRGDWDGAMKEYQKALKLRRETLGYSHLQVGQTLFNIAALHKRKDEFSESMILYKEVLRLCTLNKLPKNHPFVKEVNNEIHNLS